MKRLNVASFNPKPLIVTVLGSGPRSSAGLPAGVRLVTADQVWRIKVMSAIVREMAVSNKTQIGRKFA